MKRIFVIFAVFAAMFLIISCGDVGEVNVGDINVGTGTNDQGNSDSSTSDKKQGELYGECYPNKTCNEGLVCDEENNTCIKKTGSSENSDEDQESAPEQNNNDADETTPDNDDPVSDNDQGNEPDDSTPDHDTETSSENDEGEPISDDPDSGYSTSDDDADSSGTSVSDNDQDTDPDDSTPDEDADNQESGFDKNSKGIWVDPKPFKEGVHLIWENPMGNKGTEGRGPSHADSETYCANLVLAGVDDWRLPTIDELRTLVRGISTIEPEGKCPTTENCTDQATCNDDKDNAQGFGNSCLGCEALNTDKYDPAISYLDLEKDCQLSSDQLANNECYIVKAMHGDPCDGTWSSTPNTSTTGSMLNAFWYLNYKSGIIHSNADILSGANWVRCVREGTAADVTEEEEEATDPTEPAPVECTGFSIAPETFTYDPLSYTYHADITDIGNDDSLKDELRISFPYSDISPIEVKTYDLNLPINMNLSSCYQCVRVFQDIQSNGTPKKQFFQKGGNLTIEQVDNFNGIKGSLKANFMEVMISTDSAGEDHSIPVDNGACFELESEISFDNLCVPSCKTANGKDKVCGSDGCGGFCGENNGICLDEDMGCSADQTQCVKYECAQVTINNLSIITSASNEKFYYSASYNQTTGSETTSNKNTFNLKIRGLSMKKETDLASMSFINNCYAIVGGDPIPGQPELNSVCFYIQDKSDNNRFYFANQGKINITTLDSAGNLAATLSGGIRLVEINTVDGLPVPGGECIDIVNGDLNYNAYDYKSHL